MLLFEVIKFIVYSSLIVIISKYVLVEVIRRLAETLNIKPKIVGDITGVSTSVPELLTITTSSLRGLAGASIYNILSSNVINLIQYMFAISLNKNFTKLKNNAIKMDIILVIITIIIPIFLLQQNIKVEIYSVPLFILLFVFFIFLNSRAHKLYLNASEAPFEKDFNKKNKDNKNIVKYICILILTSILLFVVGDLLGYTLENLCNLFNVPEFIIGVLLGFITSLPELITFFESQKYHKSVKDEMFGVIEATNNLLTSNIMNLFIIQTIGVLMTNI